MVWQAPGCGPSASMTSTLMLLPDAMYIHLPATLALAGPEEPFRSDAQLSLSLRLTLLLRLLLLGPMVSLHNAYHHVTAAAIDSDAVADWLLLLAF